MKNFSEIDNLYVSFTFLYVIFRKILWGFLLGIVV